MQLSVLDVDVILRSIRSRSCQRVGCMKAVDNAYHSANFCERYVPLTIGSCLYVDDSYEGFIAQLRDGKKQSLLLRSAVTDADILHNKIVYT